MDPAKEIRSFRLTVTSTMGTKRGRGRGSFIDAVPGATDAFYADVLQLRQPGPIPPDAEPVKSHSLSSTDCSSQDGAERPDPTPDRTRNGMPDAATAAQKEHAAPANDVGGDEG